MTHRKPRNWIRLIKPRRSSEASYHQRLIERFGFESYVREGWYHLPEANARWMIARLDGHYSIEGRVRRVVRDEDPVATILMHDVWPSNSDRAALQDPPIRYMHSDAADNLSVLRALRWGPFADREDD